MIENEPPPPEPPPRRPSRFAFSRRLRWSGREAVLHALAGLLGDAAVRRAERLAPSRDLPLAERGELLPVVLDHPVAEDPDALLRRLVPGLPVLAGQPVEGFPLPRDVGDDPLEVGLLRRRELEVLLRVVDARHVADGVRRRSRTAISTSETVAARRRRGRPRQLALELGDAPLHVGDRGRRPRRGGEARWRRTGRRRGGAAGAPRHGRTRRPGRRPGAPAACRRSPSSRASRRARARRAAPRARRTPSAEGAGDASRARRSRARPSAVTVAKPASASAPSAIPAVTFRIAVPSDPDRDVPAPPPDACARLTCPAAPRPSPPPSSRSS